MGDALLKGTLSHVDTHKHTSHALTHTQQNVTGDTSGDAEFKD